MESLTEEQKKAVSHKKGPACVIAGAGTGKTTALSERIVYLVEECRIDPKRIVVTTFTRKATAELYDRAYKRLGAASHQLKISTIDALVWDLAQKAMQRELMRSARLIGEANQRVLLLQCAWETFGQDNANSIFSRTKDVDKAVLDYSFRNMYRHPWTENADKAGLVGLLEKCIRAEIADKEEKQKIKKSIRSDLEEMRNRFYLDFSFRIPTSKELKLTVKRYFEKLEELGATDHDILRMNFLNCLKQNRNLAKEFASEFDAILVDEFQDTSHSQAEILLLLPGKKRNIWVVGDPCQQIYEWRGAGPENLIWFIKKTKAKRYYLTENWRSTQPILDSAYHFLSRRIPSLEKNRMLKRLRSKRDEINNHDGNSPILTGDLDRALYLVSQLLDSDSALRPGDIAILSRKLDKRTVKEINEKAEKNGLRVQFHSSRADHAMEDTIRTPPDWRPGTALKSLYNHKSIKRLVSRSLHEKDFGKLRRLRPLAIAAEALDSTLPPHGLTLKEAWPALKKTQDREVSVTPAVVGQQDAIQVMTIHAAKGLEFPIVLLMKLGNGGPRSFPNPKNQEDSRLAYVSTTRARDLLILVHIIDKPSKTLADFGPNLIPLRYNIIESNSTKIEAPTILPAPPIIAATHLDLYEQCPLKFAAYHEGRLLPNWSFPQSMGSRMHKALEYYLREGSPNEDQVIDQCFEKGLQDGDSPLRRLPLKSRDKMKKAYQVITKDISKTLKSIFAIEEQYRYLYGNSGQIEGVVDTVIEKRDGAVVLKEWKTSAEIQPNMRRQYELQTRAGALGMAAQNSYPIQMVEIIPVFSPENKVSIPYDNTFVDESRKMLEQVFKDLRDRHYEPQRGNHCKKLCQLKLQCPAWRKN